MTTTTTKWANVFQALMLDLQFKQFMLCNPDWTAKDLQLFRKHDWIPIFHRVIKPVVNGLLSAYDDYDLAKSRLEYCAQDKDAYDSLIESHTLYREGLTMLGILFEKTPTALSSERITTSDNEWETVTLYILKTMSHMGQYPQELIELVFYSNHFDPNQINCGKTLLSYCMSHLHHPHKLISILIQHPRLNINYTDALNAHPLAMLFQKASEIYQCRQLMESVLTRKNLNVDAVMESMPHVATWSTTQDNLYLKLFLKDRSYRQCIAWEKKRLVFIARLKEQDNVWCWIPEEIVYMILVDFGSENVQPPKFPLIKNIKW